MKRVRNAEFLYERNGTFYFRRAVPQDARVAFGGHTEVVVSLATRTLAEARHRLADGLRSFDQRLASVRRTSDPTSLRAAINAPPSKDEVDAAVRVWLREDRSRNTKDFSDDAPQARERIRELATRVQLVANSRRPGAGGYQLQTEWIAEAICAARGWEFDKHPELKKHMLRTVAHAEEEAALQRSDEINGERRQIYDQRFAADQYAADQALEAKMLPTSIVGIFDAYAVERKPAPATEKAWRRHVTAFTVFLGHDDATRVEAKDVIAWKDRLLAVNEDGSRRSARTVRDTYLAGLRVAFAWAVDNHKLATNPVLGVKVRGPRAVELRDKGLNDAEAKLILRATLRPQSSRMSPAYARAFRWVPWLCAYTGARVNEMTQLRGEDVSVIEGSWAIRITPEAGSVKTGKARTVPVHEHLIEQGFLDVLKGRSGPLFYDPALHRGGGDGNPQYKKVGERIAAWVREIGVTDMAVAPNHGWRHRFKTRAREQRMDTEARDAIQGHKPATEGQTYGNVPFSVLVTEMGNLKREDIREPPAKSAV